MGLERLTGTPWHIERFTRKEGDLKRHRSRCQYYRGNGYCAWFFEHCHGSARCRHYSEAGPNGRSNNPSDKAEEKKKKLAAELKATQEAKRMAVEEAYHRQKNYEKVYTVGRMVGHKVYGNGIIKETKDGKITVRFESGKEAMFSLEACVKNQIIWLKVFENG